MSKLFTRHAVLAYLLIISVLVWSWLLSAIGAETIVEWIGAENGYWVMFVVALLGGISSIGGVTYIATIITLSSAGLDPIGLALASGLAISIGDTIYYYIGRYGIRTLTHGMVGEYVAVVSEWLNRRSRALLFAGVYLYSGWTPLPNDILTITLGVTRQPWLTCITALVLGNMTLTYLIASFGSQLTFLQ